MSPRELGSVVRAALKSMPVEDVLCCVSAAIQKDAAETIESGIGHPDGVRVGAELMATGRRKADLARWVRPVTERELAIREVTGLVKMWATVGSGYMTEEGYAEALVDKLVECGGLNEDFDRWFWPNAIDGDWRAAASAGELRDSLYYYWGNYLFLYKEKLK